MKAFAEDGNLVIHSRDLVRLWLAVERGDLTQEQARELLLGAAGVFLCELIEPTVAIESPTATEPRYGEPATRTDCGPNERGGHAVGSSVA